MPAQKHAWSWRDEAGPLLAITLLSLVMIARGYGTWCDPIIDFGRELYTPWRLVEGDVLGRDIAWFNGPLSQYWNAALFALTGPSLHALSMLNIAICLAFTLLLFRVLRRLTTRFAATCGTLAFVCFCAYSQYEPVANFNWVCPYSHEITHGVALGLLTLEALLRWRDSGKARCIFFAGVTLGLTFLTKPEVFLAAALASVVAVSLARQSGNGRLPCVALLVAGLASTIGLAWTALALHGGAANATSLVVGGWKHVGNAELSNLLFYKSSLGLDEPGRRLVLLLLASVAWASAVLLAVVFGSLATRRPSLERLFALVGALPLLVFAVLPLPARDYVDSFRIAFTPILPASALAAFVALVRTLRGRTLDRAALITWTFALVLLAKLGINCRIYHYGFALAAPALALLVATSLGPLSLWLTTRGASVRVARSTILGFWLGLAVIGFRINADYSSEKNITVGAGPDRFKASEVGAFINMVLDPLVATPPETKILVLPEGVMFNYLLRRRCPTRVINFMPPEFVMFGEASMLDDVERQPPELVIVHTRLTTEYGLPLFGRDYARGLKRWLYDHYRVEPSLSVGPDPLDEARVVDQLVGFRVWKRKL